MKRVVLIQGRRDGPPDEYVIVPGDEDPRAVYCANCGNRATHVAIHKQGEDGWKYDQRTPLCFPCKTAYEMGTANPSTRFVDIEVADEL